MAAPRPQFPDSPEAFARRLEQRIEKQERPLLRLEAVIAPTLTALNWQNLGGAWLTAGYYKDQFGIVHLQGAVQKIGVGNTIFTLPAGYRPAADVRFVAAGNGAFAGVDILAASGNVNLSLGAANGSLFLDGMSFRAA